MHKRTALFRKAALRAAAFVALAGAALVAPAAAQAQEGDFMRSLLGQIGIIPEDKDPIVYRERPPLVVPPSATLPAPAPNVAERNPAWPKDPEVVERKRQAERAREPQRGSRNGDVSQGGRLSPEELARGRTTSAVRGTDDESGDLRRRSGWMSFDALRPGQKSEAEEAIAYGREPERRYLSDPPAGLRLPANNATINTRITAEPNRPPVDDAEAREFVTRRQ